MAILETLEGDDPEILDSMATASAKSWEPNISDMLRRRRAKTMSSGIPAKHRAAGSGKATSPNRSGRMVPQRCGMAGAQKWGASGHYVVPGDNLDPETLEGWLTSLKKGVGSVAKTVSQGVRAVGSVQMDIARSVAPIAGTVLGKAAAAYTGNPTALSAGGVDTGGGGLLSSLSSALGFNTASAPPTGGYVQSQPATVPAASSGIGGIPTMYLVGGGVSVVLLVLLLKK